MNNGYYLTKMVGHYTNDGYNYYRSEGSGVGQGAKPDNGGLGSGAGYGDGYGSGKGYGPGWGEGNGKGNGWGINGGFKISTAFMPIEMIVKGIHE